MASNSFTGNKNVITSRTEFLLKEMVQEKLTKSKKNKFTWKMSNKTTVGVQKMLAVSKFYNKQNNTKTHCGYLKLIHN